MTGRDKRISSFTHIRGVFCLRDDARKIKKFGVLKNSCEHQGRDLASGYLTKSKIIKKSEELKNILTNNWDHIKN